MAPGTRYRYRLEVVGIAGGSSWEGPVEVATAAERLAWRGATPNPFADTVELELAGPDPRGTRVWVYDVTGHEIARLEARADGSRWLVRWNGRDRSGRIVAPGVYLLRAQQGDRTVVRQVVRMR